MFADDFMICSESREQGEDSLERRGLKIRSSMTEYSVNKRETGRTEKLEKVEIVKLDDIKYLGSSIKINGWCTREVKERVQCGG